MDRKCTVSARAWSIGNTVLATYARNPRDALWEEHLEGIYFLRDDYMKRVVSVYLADDEKYVFDYQLIRNGFAKSWKLFGGNVWR